MIFGEVNADGEALVALTLVGTDAREVTINAVIDTGYAGSLTLPREVVDALALPLRGLGTALLADGSEISFATYAGIVIWDGQPRSVDVDTAAVEPLIGMGLLADYEITIQVRPGGAVRIVALEP